MTWLTRMLRAAAEQRGRSRQAVYRQLPLPTCRLLAGQGRRQPAVKERPVRALCGGRGTGARQQPMRRSRNSSFCCGHRATLALQGSAVLQLCRARVGHRAQSVGSELAKVMKLGNPEIAKRLLEKGADPNLKDSAGFAVLHDAARAGFLDTLQTLLDSQADVNVEDNEGNLPLHLAAQEGHLPVVAFLLQHPASKVDHRNKKGANAYDVAKLYRRDAVARLLEGPCGPRAAGAPSGD
uniref:Uncharacterized protein n=1 Tax=Sphaerodactylus townsendi TaxID=933632 RepID=A0ACB8F485_9SAUR